jgi:hypothetical protein
LWLSEALAKGYNGLRPEHFSIKELAEAFMPGSGGARFTPGFAGSRFNMNLMEAGDGVDVTAFAHITGQIFFNKIADGWERADRIGESLTYHYPTKLDGERIPWIGHVRSLGEEVHPGMPYTETSMGERYVDTPRCQKQGEILSLTKEAIFFDHTGQMLRGSEELGEALAYNKEEMILAVILGIYNTYTLNGVNSNTYQQSTDPQTTPNLYTNRQTNTPFVDWTSINNYYILSPRILDPDSGLPLVMKPKMLLVMPPRVIQANRVVNGTQTRNTYPGYGVASPAAPGNVTTIAEGSALPDKLTVMTSSIAYNLLLNPPANSGFTPLTQAQADDTWFIGDPQRSFYWMENWPLQIEQAPVGNLRQFEQDIMMRWKVSFRGQCAVFDPRYIFKFSI